MRRWGLTAVSVVWFVGFGAAQHATSALDSYVDRDLRKLDRATNYQLAQDLNRVLPREFGSTSYWSFEPWFVWKYGAGEGDKRFVLLQVSQPRSEASFGLYAIHLLDKDGKRITSRCVLFGRKQRAAAAKFGRGDSDNCMVVQIRLANANGGHHLETYAIKNDRLTRTFDLSLPLRDPTKWQEALTHGNGSEKIEALTWLANTIAASPDHRPNDGATELASAVWARAGVRKAINELANSDDERIRTAAKEVLRRGSTVSPK